MTTRVWHALACAVGSLAIAAEPLSNTSTTRVADLSHVAPTEPAKAVSTFKCLDGFHMDLLAAEPLVTDPVAMCYDEDGRAYVAEMNDYPYTDSKTHQAFKENPNDKSVGKIRLLADTDGDGVFDKSTVFAEGLSWPTGVACYKGGVFVCATPDVWYFKDTDGDGKADVKRKIFTGFRKFNVQAVMNNLEWGLDNKLYGAGGTNGGMISSPGHPELKPLTITRNDFRFDPATETFELIPGGARFGNAFDDWGDRFVCNIRNPAQHVVLDTRYLMRNPFAPPIASVVHDVAESGDALPVFRISPQEAWRDLRATRLVAEKSKQPRSELVAGGVVTSSSGITVYRGGAYAPEFRDMFFIGEVANNLIHRQVMQPDGITFSSKRVDEKVDFVASSDVWFRPVNFVNAPDGTLHVLDMYREVIEHPWSIPDDIREKLDLRSGADRGRIYRLAPNGFKVPEQPKLGAATAIQLVAQLANRNSWWRESAQRLLVERQDKSAVAPLRDLLQNSQEPLARLHALWTLEGLGAATGADLSRGLVDSSTGMRENALRVAEHHLEGVVLNRVLELARDPDLRVRFQVALTLGESNDPRVTDALATLARNAEDDEWLRAAILSSCATRAAELVEQLAKSDEGTGLIKQLAVITGAQNKREDVSRVVRAMGSARLAIRMLIASGLGEGLKRNRITLHDAIGSDAVFTDAVNLARDRSKTASDRLPAIAVLAFGELTQTEKTISELLDPRQPPEVQRAAVAALSAINSPKVGPLLMTRWASYTPAVRAEVVQAMLGYKNRVPALLEALEAGKVLVRDIPTSRRPSLVNHADESIRTRAAKIFGDASVSANRKAVIDKFKSSLDLRGDAAVGRKVFEAACVQCHRIDNVGTDVGPNLATIRQWSAEQILTNVLDPNREVAPAFSEYVVQLTDGETLSGVVAEETGTSITLKMSGGAQRVLSRQSVKRIAGSGVSLMPEGLEAQMSSQQMADLIAFLRGPQ
jgi:putative membrane-bound dehydrogenase-like protein